MLRLSCVLTLSLVFLCFVLCYHKGYDDMLNYKIMFKFFIKTRKSSSFNSDTIHLLSCNNSTVPPTPFRHIHHLPLKICSKKLKEVRNVNWELYGNEMERKIVLFVVDIIFGSKAYLQIILCVTLLMI